MVLNTAQRQAETPKTMHILDNPIWNSLSTLHAHFAEGDELAKRRSEEHTSELQSLTGSSYAVFCLDRKSVV